ncbi:MAG: prephenate dehydrogenase/arogenate dehydrogenase family protein, partial [Bacteroidales bacterium]|nr:prephenate dehydrogenase/arogenate dehydrogenase family protein [Bacteroidales bacterium]
MNIVVIGTGLIGGSMALSARGFETKIIGVDASEENLKKAMELGIIDMAMPLEQAVQIADLIII